VKAAAGAASERDWNRAEQHCWDAQALRIWDAGTLTMLSRIFEMRRDHCACEAARRGRREGPVSERSGAVARDADEPLREAPAGQCIRAGQRERARGKGIPRLRWRCTRGTRPHATA
jgi:hypothetical protein